MDKVSRFLLGAMSLLLIMRAGCGPSDHISDEVESWKAREEKSWQICIDQGGIPIQSEFSADVLGDCKFKEVQE